VRAVSLHPDVIVVTSALLRANCLIVRGGVAPPGGQDLGAAQQVGGPRHPDAGEWEGETFVIDSPVLPDELEALPSLVEQARFPAPCGLLATHGDWDHLLGRLAFPALTLGCSERTHERLRTAPGEAQRELRAFDEALMIERPQPLGLGSVQALPVPGRCDIGDRQLELHLADGHTPEGMAIVVPWAGVLVAGDYLSTAEIPTLNAGGSVDPYLATLERLRPLIDPAGHVVPGHGPILTGQRALAVLDEDRAYLLSLRARGTHAELPPGRRNAANRAAHLTNVSSV
jgi:glyoxylase-like metal-dependent hydrolase (beta-lactamase superfamily II)